jgi:hypothetical protein
MSGTFPESNSASGDSEQPPGLLNRDVQKLGGKVGR